MARDTDTCRISFRSSRAYASAALPALLRMRCCSTKPWRFWKVSQASCSSGSAVITISAWPECWCPDFELTTLPWRYAERRAHWSDVGGGSDCKLRRLGQYAENCTKLAYSASFRKAGGNFIAS